MFDWLEWAAALLIVMTVVLALVSWAWIFEEHNEMEDRD